MIRLTVLDIQHIVAAHFRMPVSAMRSSCRRRAHARPRQIAIWFARRLTGLSSPELGRRFGGRDHTTVLYACRHVDRLIAADVEVANDVADIEFDMATLPRFACLGCGSEAVKLPYSSARLCRTCVARLAVRCAPAVAPMQGAGDIPDDYRPVYRLARNAGCTPAEALVVVAQQIVIDRRRGVTMPEPA